MGLTLVCDSGLLRKPVWVVELYEQKKPGSYAGLGGDPEQAGSELLKRI